MFWKQSKSTGIMQVTANKPLSDAESVVLGSDILAQAWAKHAVEQSHYDRVWNTIANYNADTDYISRVQEVIEILAMRVEPKFRPAFSEIWE